MGLYSEGLIIKGNLQLELNWAYNWRKMFVCNLCANGSIGVLTRN